MAKAEPDSQVRRIQQVLIACLAEDDIANVDSRVLGISVFEARQFESFDPVLLDRAEERLDEVTAWEAEQTVHEPYEEIEDPEKFIDKLFEGVGDGDLKVVRECLDKYRDTEQQVPVDVADHEGNTPLSEASCYGEVEIMQLLLERRAHPDVRNDLGRTPIWRACYNGHLEAVQLLLQNGADKYITNNLGEAPGKYGTKETKQEIISWDDGQMKERRATLGLDKRDCMAQEWNYRRERKASKTRASQDFDSIAIDPSGLIEALFQDKDNAVLRATFAKRFQKATTPNAVLQEPEWPIKIQLQQMGIAIDTAFKFGKVPMIVCNGMDYPEQYLQYTGEALIDAKKILNEVFCLKRKTVNDMRFELNEKLLKAMDTHGHGLMLQIRMGNSACNFKQTFCQPGLFPAEVFGGPAKWHEAEVKKHFPSPMIVMQPEFRFIITTAFSLSEAMEHLPDALPYFKEMAIIEIEPM